MKEELEFGKRYTWNEVVEAYPGKWVRMSQCTLIDGAGITDGVLVGVYSDEEHGHVLALIIKDDSDDILRRATSEMSIGVITCLNARMGG